MIDTDEIFRYKIPNDGKLRRYGFDFSSGYYIASLPVTEDGQLVMNVKITPDGKVDYTVTETETGEEYVLVKIENAVGAFVGEVRSACQKLLEDISDKCFDVERLKAEQSVRVVNFIKSEFDTDPEFLWADTPDCGAFRFKGNRKWFGLIMSVDRGKIGLSGKGTVEILNLKDDPNRVLEKLENTGFFKAYHMNKKHWYTIALDGSVKDEAIFECIRDSYKSVAVKNKKRSSQ